MYRCFLIIGFLLSIIHSLNAQVVCSSEDEKNIYWQPNAQIDFGDYKSQSLEDCHKYNEKYGMTSASSIGFRGIVDVPTKKRKLDKAYFAPVFCKNCSCILSEDSLNLLVDRLLFDIAEICTRNARKELQELQKTMKIDNVNTMFFTTINNKWEKQMRSFFAAVLRDIFIEKKNGAYEEWRKTADDLLKDTSSYATQLEDCYRFIKGEPIEKGYIMANSIMGDLEKKNEEKK